MLRSRGTRKRAAVRGQARGPVRRTRRPLRRATKAVLLSGALEAGRARAVRRRHKAAVPTIATPTKTAKATKLAKTTKLATTAKKSQQGAPVRALRRGAR